MIFLIFLCATTWYNKTEQTWQIKLLVTIKCLFKQKSVNSTMCILCNYLAGMLVVTALFMLIERTFENWHTQYQICLWRKNCLYITGAGIAQWSACQSLDWKVMGSSPGRSGGRIFFFRVNFLCWLLFWYPFNPCVTTAAHNRSQSFYQIKVYS